ncbi:MAG: 4Fe-4S binding protein [Dehalococcoidia bacterium]
MEPTVTRKPLKQFRVLPEVKRHRQWQLYNGILFLILLAAGWFFPPIGYVMFVWMALIMGFGMTKGRYFCDWMCPRGSLLDSYISHLSPKRKIPGLFSHIAWRLSWMAIMMGVLILMITRNWDHWWKLGHSLTLMITVTTVIGLVLGFIYNQRAWCMFCPFGTMANWLGRGKHLLCVSPDCLGDKCRQCQKVCRMQIHAGGYSETGEVRHGDCLKCSRCIEVCPKGALSWDSSESGDVETR